MFQNAGLFHILSCVFISVHVMMSCVACVRVRVREWAREGQTSLAFHLVRDRVLSCSPLHRPGQRLVGC